MKELQWTLTYRLPVSHLSISQLCPARVVVEMTNHYGDVSVSRLTEWLTIVHTLKDRKQTLVLLDMTCNTVNTAKVSMENSKCRQVILDSTHIVKQTIKLLHYCCYLC